MAKKVDTTFIRVVHPGSQKQFIISLNMVILSGILEKII